MSVELQYSCCCTIACRLGLAGQQPALAQVRFTTVQSAVKTATPLQSLVQATAASVTAAATAAAGPAADLIYSPSSHLPISTLCSAAVLVLLQLPESVLLSAHYHLLVIHTLPALDNAGSSSSTHRSSRALRQGHGWLTKAGG